TDSVALFLFPYTVKYLVIWGPPRYPLLTYMATLAGLVAAGLGFSLDVKFHSWRPPERDLFFFPILAERMPEALAEGSTWKIDESPAQQLDALTHNFVNGVPLCIDRQLKHLTHLEGGIWYLKTADVRMFGWFPHRDFFVAATIATAE